MLNTSSNSLLKLYSILYVFVKCIYIYAKLHTSNIVITKNKSFINILKNKGLRIEVSLSISCEELYQEPILELWRFDGVFQKLQSIELKNLSV